ncbi:MAG: hypothetical protein VX689_00195 [Bacteroidota bacterium]|nr:hypothetical protein [Bacteroidota bacterium]
MLISIIAFLLLNPVIRSNIKITENPIVIIAKDNSKSIKDNINDNLQYLIEGLDGFDVFSYSFSDVIHEGFSETNNGLKTDYSMLFSEINNRFENRNVAGLILASDGCYNTGINPEYLSYDFPVYSIALGDTSVYKDIRIDKVLKNDIAFFGNTFPLEISLASSLTKNEKSKIKIWHNGTQVHEENVTFLEDINYHTYTVYLPANNIGLQTYIIELDALNDEKNIVNNVFETYIDVIDSRYNILILKDKNSPDLSAYKSAIESNQNYKIDIEDINSNVLIEKYQLVVLFGISSIPTSILNSNIPLIIFNSKSSDYIDLRSGIIFTQQGGVQEVGAFKNHSFLKFSFSAELLRLIEEAPPLFSFFGQYEYKGDIEFVLKQKIGGFESNNPIIMIQNLNFRKICFISSEGWWKWKLYDYSLNKTNFAFDELFSKLSQYLILQEDKSLFRLEYAKQYEENSEVVFRAAVYNESYELVNEKEVFLKLVDEKNKEYNFKFFQEGDDLVARLGVLEAGTYNFTANVQDSDLFKKGVFDVKKIQIEQFGLAANHQVLDKISFLSNGKLFYLNDIQNLIDHVKKSKGNHKLIHSKEKLEGLINISWILLSLLVLISVEWFFRKYNGLI